MLTLVEVHKMCPNVEYDFSILKRNLCKIIQKLHIKSYGDLKRDTEILFESKRLLESAIIFIQNMIDPKLNSFIENYKEDYHLLIDNMGRWNKKLDNYADNLTKAYGTSNKAELTIKIRLLKELLVEGLENLVYMPLITANIKLESAKKEDKGIELFGYFVFFNLSNTTFILAPITREETGFRKKSGVSTFVSPTMPPFPEGVTPKIDNSELEEESGEIIEYYSSEPSILNNEESD